MVYINAVSIHLPNGTLDNATILKEYHEYGGSDDSISDDSIWKQSGVCQRFVSLPDDTPKDLGIKAIQKLWEEWEVDKSEVEFLIFVSGAPDYKGPATSRIIQAELGLATSIGTMDILDGCTGWMYGINMAKVLILSGQVSNVLLVAAEVPTKVIHPLDTEIRSLFSDGAAATFIST